MIVTLAEMIRRQDAREREMQNLETAIHRCRQQTMNVMQAIELGEDDGTEAEEPYD